MNKMLERAVAAARTLPDEEQEAIACLILEEMEAEKGWEERFARSEDLIGDLVRQAREEVARGDVLPFDPATRPGK